jgi:DNA-binding transcriptional ArsR family regulator
MGPGEAEAGISPVGSTVKEKPKSKRGKKKRRKVAKARKRGAAAPKVEAPVEEIAAAAEEAVPDEAVDSLEAEGDLEGAGATGRRTNLEGEEVRAKILGLKMRGFTVTRIAAVLGETVRAVSYHLKKLRQEKYDEVTEDGGASLTGDYLAILEQLFRETLVQMYGSPTGSASRNRWMKTALDIQYERRTFLQDCGFLAKAADKLEIDVNGINSMSKEELEDELWRTTKELTGAKIVPISGIARTG